MTALAEHLVLREHAHDAADRGPDEDAGPLRIDPFGPGVRPRLAGGRDGEDDVPLEPTRVLRAYHRFRLEPLHLGRDPHREVARVERLDPVDAAPARDRRLPGRRGVEPERRDCSETGDGDAAHDHGSLEA